MPDSGSGGEAVAVAPLSAHVLVQARTLNSASHRLPGSLKEDLGRVATAAERLDGLVAGLTLPDAVEQDVSQARHDLRTPLNHILGYTEMLFEDLDGAGEGGLTTTLELLYADARRLLEAINGIGELPLLPREEGSAGEVEEWSAKSAPVARRPARASAEAGSDEEPAQILVVDDVAENREVLVRRLRRLGCEATEAVDGLEALGRIAEQPFDAVLLDIMMPKMDGYEVLKRLKADPQTAHIPVIMISAVGESNSVVQCIEDGAEDYLPKPFDPVLLKARLNTSLARKRLQDRERHYQQQVEQHNEILAQRVQAQVREISQSQLGAIFALSKLAESRDPETGAHLDRIREYCGALARQLARLSRYADVIDEAYVDNLYAASPLHDIGKVGIPDEILRKPGRLTDEEFATMCSHPAIGAETLRAVDREHPGNAFIRFGIEIAEAHHERWDGTGYPHGLAGEAIPLSARIVALADVYDALRSRRVYKPAMDHEQARSIILESRESHFDPELVDAFLAAEGELQTIWNRLQDD